MSTKRLESLKRQLHLANLAEMATFHPKVKASIQKRIARLQSQISKLEVR